MDIVKSKRKSNIELLRIICMLVVIIHHCVTNSGGITSNISINQIFSIIFVPAGKIAFVCFIAISTWFLVEKDFKFSRFFNVWIEVLFYNVIMIMFSYVMGEKITINNIIGTFFPITGNSHGFISSYLAFYLLVPFLNKMLSGLNKIQAYILMLIIGYIQIIGGIIAGISTYVQPIRSELTLFVFCFIMSYTLKKWPIKIIQNTGGLCLLFILCWIIGFLQFYFMQIYPSCKILTYSLMLVADESSLLYILSGYALLFICLKIKIPMSKCINNFAGTMLGILLIHDNNFFRTVFWHVLFKSDAWVNSTFFIGYTLSLAILIMVILGGIERIRAYMFNFIISLITPLKKVFNKIDFYVNQDKK